MYGGMSNGDGKMRSSVWEMMNRAWGMGIACGEKESIMIYCKIINLTG
jgi:hypothetical protein